MPVANMLYVMSRFEAWTGKQNWKFRDPQKKRNKEGEGSGQRVGTTMLLSNSLVFQLEKLEAHVFKQMCLGGAEDRWVGRTADRGWLPVTRKRVIEISDR